MRFIFYKNKSLKDGVNVLNASINVGTVLSPANFA